MFNKYHYTVFLIILFFNIFVLSCGHKENGVQAIALLDFSGSLSDAEFEEYIHMLSKGLIQNLTIKDAITLAPIDQAAETKFQVIAHRDMKEFETQIKSEIGRYEKLRETEIRRKTFKALKDTLFKIQIKKYRKMRKSFRSKTDILGAIREAISYWGKSDPRAKLLFIFSDMIQESDDLNLKNIRSEKEVNTYLHGLKRKGVVPDLHNVSVFVCGATSKNIKEYRLCKEFWEKYFSDTGAHLYAYGYGNYNRIEEFLEQNRKTDN